MPQTFVTRLRGQYVMVTALGILASQGCGSEESPSTPASPSENEGGTSVGGGGSSAGGASSGAPDMSDPSMTGSESQGGAPPLTGTGATGGTSTAVDGMGGSAEPDVPMYEQDDPNLHPPDSEYERVEIPVDVTNVMAIDIDEQGRVYVLERAGGFKIWYPDENRVADAGTLSVFSGNEDGALSVSLDPNFLTNGWVYIYHSSSDANENVLSRFQIVDDELDFASESVLLTVPDEREERYHVAGGTDFDSQGNLYVSTGDNTDPFASNGFSPHDERAGRGIWDAQRSAANSRDFRGKILRIKPTDDGGYEIPEGNLFTEDQGLPEIFTMGNRNPFRIAIDTANDWLYWGEVGPDAGGDQLATRGPRGYDEINQAKGAGFFGWPYCISTNIPYISVDFANLASRGAFNCNAPVNNSPNNTGLNQLPPAQPAWIAYSYGTTPYPALGANGGRTAIVGDIYRWKPGGSPNKLPRYYDGSVLVLEHIRNRMVEVRTDADGNIQSVDNLFESFTWSQLIQGRISPSGVFHVAQYGPESTVYRMNYIGNDGP